VKLVKTFCCGILCFHNFCRPALDDITHNSALESLGFLSLFLPTSILKRSECDLQLSTQDWISECLKLWASLPNCRYWNLQWASLIARCIKHSVGSVDWEPFLPTLFTSFLRSFEVPVGKAGAWSPVQRHIPHEVAVAFDSRSSLTFSKVYAKSIVSTSTTKSLSLSLSVSDLNL
jgi:proteasome activator subunit 4